MSDDSADRADSGDNTDSRDHTDSADRTDSANHTDLADDTDLADRAARARRYVLDEHAATVETVLACADAVAEEWDGPTTDPGAVAGPLRAELEVAGAWGRLPDVLAGAVRAAGYSLPASPVAEPPYVAATSRGPMLRATVAEGRLVVLVEAFAVERDPVRYARAVTTPRDAVSVTFE